MSCVLVRPDILDKAHKARWQNNWKYGEHVIEIVRDNGVLSYKIECPHEDCKQCEDKYFISEPQIYRDRLRIGSEVCTRLHPMKSVNSSTSIELFIQNFLDTNNILYIKNDRTKISPLELDFYIPSLNIAIECNGVWWHSLKDQKYHINKFMKCKENGI